MTDSIPTHPRKRLELVIDRAHLNRFTKVLEAKGVQGYTILQTLAGKGTHGTWTPARLTDANDRVMIVAVTSEDKAAIVLEALSELFEELPGVAFASDVDIIRPERF